MIRFVDQATIEVAAGRGGKGCRSYYRDLWTRHPIPNGGDGGRGGDVVIRANPQLTTLLDFQAKRFFKAGSGGHASSKRKHGARGSECLIEVPLGTLLWDAATGDLIREILHPGDEVTVARGGAGGVGNASREKSRSSPRFPKPGETLVLETNPLEASAGESRRIRLELKIVADVGIVGLPNAGKSTLLSCISHARPKVASYPFTTTEPILGAVDSASQKQFVAVEVPGLIEGAHQGKGLGLDFLRHIERTRLLVHLVDMAGTEGRDPVSDYQMLNRELYAYHPEVAAKPQIVVANKMDEPQAAKNLAQFKKKVKQKVFGISAKTGQGVPQLLKEVNQRLKTMEPADD